MTKSWDPSGISPQALLNLGVSSVAELTAIREARIAARQELAEYMARPDVSGPEKQVARCAYIHKQGRLACQCPTCWLLPGNCVCGKLKRAEPATRVIIHLHQDEWGRGSNTGCLCAASLSGSTMLLRGHTPHDQQLSALLSDPSVTTALLWPGEDALEPHQLQELAAARTNGRIALVAIDATWNGAVKMRRRYPKDILTVRLPPDLALPEIHHTAAYVGAGLQTHPQDTLQQATDTANGSSSSPQPERLPAGSNDGSNAGSSSSHTCASSADRLGSSGSSSVPPGVAKGAGPKHIPKPGERVSIFRGVRKYHGKAAENGRVSTLEAVAAALLALEGDEGVYQGLLYNLKLKVDAMRQQKHMPAVFGTAGESFDNDE